MKLIVLAHYGEAQSIIDHYSLSKKSEELYQNSQMTLLLTGEGPFEATARMSSLLGSGNYSSVINLGIVGSLNPKLLIGEIYEVRTVYLAIDGKLQYKSFTLSDKGLDLITSFERILKEEKAEVLKGFGELVDREAWGVAFSCKDHGVPLRSFKLISDVAGTLGACESVKESAPIFSLKLLAKLKEILNQKEEAKPDGHALDDSFYFTFSLKHKFQNLLEMICLRDELSAEEVMKRVDLNELKELNISSKNRAKMLVDKLEILIDPFKGKLQAALLDWKKKYQGLDIITDPQWESEEIKFIFQVKDQDELKQKIHLLQSVDLAPYQNLLKGKVDVE